MLVIINAAYGNVLCVEIECECYTASIVYCDRVYEARCQVGGDVYFLVYAVDDVYGLVQAPVVLFVLLWFSWGGRGFLRG